VAVAVRVAVTVLSPATTQRQRQSRNNNGRGKWLKLPRNKECFGNFPLLGPAAFVANHSYIVVQHKRTKGQDMVAKRKKKVAMYDGKGNAKFARWQQQSWWRAVTNALLIRSVGPDEFLARWVHLTYSRWAAPSWGLSLSPCFFPWPLWLLKRNCWQINMKSEHREQWAISPPQQPNQNIIIP